MAERAFFFGLLVALAGGCASAARGPGAASVAYGPIPESWRPALTSASPINGSLVRLTVVPPPEVRARLSNPSGPLTGPLNDPLKPGEALTGEFADVEFPFFPAPEAGEGVYEALVPIPYTQMPGPADIRIRLGATHGGAAGPAVSEAETLQAFSIPLKIEAGDYPSETIRVPERRVNPRRSDLARIRREQQEVGRIYLHVTEHKYWTGPFVMPVHSIVTSAFGMRRLYNGEMHNFHPGVDLRAHTGTPIHSAAPGIVVLAKNLFFTGNTVMIDHGYGVITLYAHMSRLKVRKGQLVKSGTLLGLAGKTGRANGPHLHWQAVVNRVKVNPFDLTKVMD